MKWMLLSLCLIGCAQVPVNQDMETMVRADVANRVMDFNKLRSANLPVPEVVFTTLDEGDYGEVSGTRQGRPTPIYIDTARCEANIEDCVDDTIPHELAHWALWYFGYYHVRTDFSPSAYPGRIPPSRSYTVEDEHDGVWCDTMRAFGGVPEKHGYCH
jgi:hypothetical protein